MEIAFLITKKDITNRHNYTLTSLRKFISKYNEQTDIPYVFHCGDFKSENPITYLPLYMVPLI